MENRFIFNLDIKQNVINDIKFQQGDLNGSVLEAHLFDNSVVKDITGATVEFRFLKPDNTPVYQNSGITIDKVTILDPANGVVECILNPAALSQTGILKCEIKLTSNDGSEVTVPYFRLTVNSSIGIDGILSSSYISAVEKLKDAYETALHDGVTVELVKARHDNVLDVDYDNVADRMDAQSASLADKAKQADLDTQTDRINNITTSAGNYYTTCLNTDTNALLVVASGATTGQINLTSVTPKLDTYTPAVGDYVRLVSNGLTAETTDIRVGADGITYSNAGSAVRTQIGILNNNINSISSSTNNGDRLFPNIVSGRYDPNTGALTADSNYVCFSLSVQPREHYKMSGHFGTNYACALAINASGSVIAKLGGSLVSGVYTDYEIIIPDNTVEIRCSFMDATNYYPYIFKYGYRTYGSYDKQLRVIKAYNAGNTIHSMDFVVGTYDFTNNVINYRGTGRQRAVSRTGFTLYKPLTLKCTDWTTYVCRYAKAGDTTVSYAAKDTILTIGDYLFIEFYTITAAYISDYSFVYNVFSLTDTSITDNTSMITNMITNNLNLLAKGAVWSDNSANYMTNTGYPTISNNVITGYGTETYWYHKEVTPDYGLMVSFRVMPNAGIRAYMYYVDSVGKILKEEVKGSATAFTEVRHPLIAPTGCTKIIIMSSTSAALRVEKVSANTLQTALPTYYTDIWINNLLSQIKEKTKFANGIAFTFITDCHWGFNAQNSKYLLKTILDGTTIPFTICGGDFPVAYGTSDDVAYAGDTLVAYQNFVGANRFFTIRGNHDFTIKASATDSSGYTAPLANTYNYICRKQERWVTHLQPNNLCYYLENEAQKTRIVCMNSSDGQSDSSAQAWGVNYKVSQDQVNWILNDALSKDGYKYIFVSHIPADPSLVGYDNSQDVIHEIVKALKNRTNLNYSNGTITAVKDFTSSTSSAIVHITGHCHTDQSHVDNNMLSVTTTSDACYSYDGESGVLGTLTEQAFDVYCVNFDTGTIDTVRVGRGSNRTWTY